MIKFYETIDNKTVEIVLPKEGCWINSIQPTKEEITYLIEYFKINPEFIKSSLDEDERSHIDYDDDKNQCLIIADYPHYNEKEDSYITGPIGIVITSQYIFTIGNSDYHITEDVFSGRIKDVNTHDQSHFFLTLILRMTEKYLAYLSQIDRLTTQTEKTLHKSLSNDDLMTMLKYEKAYVYFSTSLKADEVMLTRIHRGHYIHIDEDDEDLLDDILIEIRQAIEMCIVYKEILHETMDTFSNIIGNNLNQLMKKLTLITMAMEIPNAVYGFYGMNVAGLPAPVAWFPFIFSILLALAAYGVFTKVY